MTYNPNQPVTPANYPPPRKSRKGLFAVVGLAAFVVVMVVACLGVAVGGADRSPGPGSALVTTPKLTPNPGEQVPDRGTVPAPRDLGVKDFKVSLKITSKDCIDFQTIPDECSYTYEVRLAIADPDAYKAAGDSYSITFEVKGLKGGAQVDTLEVDGDGAFTQFPGFGSAGPKAKLTVRVTDVEKRP